MSSGAGMNGRAGLSAAQTRALKLADQGLVAAYFHHSGSAWAITAGVRQQTLQILADHGLVRLGYAFDDRGRRVLKEEEERNG